MGALSGKNKRICDCLSSRGAEKVLFCFMGVISFKVKEVMKKYMFL